MRKVFVGLLFLMFASTVLGATAAEQFRARRWPTAPKLSADSRAEVCQRILRDAMEDFASDAVDLDLASAIANDFPPLSPSRLGNPDDASPLSRLDLDLDGTGHTQVVVFRDNAFNWQGDWHYAYVFASSANYGSAMPQIVNTWATTPEPQYPSAKNREFSAQQYFPSALTTNDQEIRTGDVWSEHWLFEADKRVFFVSGMTAFDRELPTPIQVFRLRADGHVEVACTIEPGEVDETYDAFTKLPAISSYLATIRRIGAGGDDQGTMHSGTAHDLQARASEIRAAYRPWAASAEKDSAVPEHPYYRFDDRAQLFLDSWSLEGLWNRREFQALLELTAPAEASYATYLRSDFGMSSHDARMAAVKVIQDLLGARLEVPSEFSIDNYQLYFPTTLLHQAVMERDRRAFDSALASLQAGGHPPPFSLSMSTPQILADALLDAIEWPHALERLLTAGANPNAVNTFGKTALMIAAHFDRPDSARVLIAAGAEINAKTHDVPGGLEGPKITNRTALMYAAENASPAIFKVLLDAGADAAAKDSEGHNVAYYLRKNPRFTTADRSLGVVGLAKEYDRFAGPSYSCGKARTASERAICGSEALRIFDGEIAKAFSLLVDKDGATIRETQRQWLQFRDQHCSADVDCLAETMRTHLRVLHARLSE